MENNDLLTHINDALSKIDTLPKAIILAVQLSGLSESKVYTALNMSRQTWHYIKSGSRELKAEEIIMFQKVVGNNFLTAWIDSKSLSKDQDGSVK
jgi:hypothetical protein